MTEVSSRVSQIISELDIDEKVSLVHGTIDPEGIGTGYLSGIDRLGIPPLRLTDGPLGVSVSDGCSTAFPATIALAATFDPHLGRQQGAALGREAKAHDIDILLAPGTNIIRVPHCGRNFEYFSEDPVLSSAFASEVVEGIESEDVLSCVKHYVSNNQETARADIDVDVDEQTLRELYLPAFRAAVDAGTGSVMAAYNSVNGSLMSEHSYLLQDVLKGEWDFDGIVMSDWFATEDTTRSANGGLDVEMPGVTGAEFAESLGMGEGSGGVEILDALVEEFNGGIADHSNIAQFEKHLADEVESGSVSQERLDNMVARVLTQIEKIDRLDEDRPDGVIDSTKHRELAEEIATRSTVLLKNDGTLPLDDDADIALIGPNIDSAAIGGNGSNGVSPVVESSPRQGLTERARGSVTGERGVPPIEDLPVFGPPADNDGQESGNAVDMESAVRVAQDADVAVVVVQDQASEARDRDDLRLPGEQDALIEAISKANERTVVVINSSGPIELPWRDEVAAVVENWYPGQAQGDALAAVLFGDRDPSGRLPVTFASESDYPTGSSTAEFPGEEGIVKYSEGRLVGYRYFDKRGADLIYPFGHGHSYASFSYLDAVQLEDYRVSVTIENTTERLGREVVQLYVRSPIADSSTDEPVRTLAGFKPVSIPASDTVTVDVELDPKTFSRYLQGEWEELQGPFVVEIGRSAGDIRIDTEVTID